MKTADSTVKQVYQEKNPNKGYGGKYGTDQVMDKVNYHFSNYFDDEDYSILVRSGFFI